MRKSRVSVAGALPRCPAIPSRAEQAAVAEASALLIRLGAVHSYATLLAAGNTRLTPLPEPLYFTLHTHPASGTPLLNVFAECCDGTLQLVQPCEGRTLFLGGLARLWYSAVHCRGIEFSGEAMLHPLMEHTQTRQVNSGHARQGPQAQGGRAVLPRAETLVSPVPPLKQVRTSS